MRRIIISLLIIIISAKTKPSDDLSYFLDASRFDENITRPQDFFGYLPGDYHIPYFQLGDYLNLLSQQSDRILAQKYGETFEKRPLYLFTVSSPQNLKNLEAIRAQHLKLTDPKISDQLDIDTMPVVVWLGYSVHGNEASGANCVPLLLYRLAADTSPEMTSLLENMVILIDPCINPDGYDRFTSWVNMYRGAQLVADPNNQEHREAWPGGRTNHYWFDLNRDWLLLQQPESQARISQFHSWMPNVVNDHHEMGSNSTYFFQPGVPSRKNPLIPDGNTILNKKIAQFHAAALDSIGALYFSEEQFDDFYFGKGSTYPDLQGAIGILFEQGSSRGMVQENRFGQISFRYGIRNQLQTSLATLEAANELCIDLLDYQRSFFQESLSQARKSTTKAYLFSEKFDSARLEHFVKLLLQHKIKVFHLKKKAEIENQSFDPESTFLVPVQQRQYRLIKALFERPVEFSDSLFYDVSAWTLPLAFNIACQKVTASISTFLGEEVSLPLKKATRPELHKGAYAYAFSWDSYYAPRALNKVLSKGFKATVAIQPFSTFDHHFERGTILLPASLQKNQDGLISLLREIANSDGVETIPISTGLTPTGPDLGSSSMRSLEQPKLMLVIGEGISSTQAGEIWHLLDQRYQIKTSLVRKDHIRRLDLNRYNRIIMPAGSYADLDSATVAKIANWIENGGTLVAFGSACRWLANQNLASAKFKKEKKGKPNRRPFSERPKDVGAKRLSGAIFQVNLDLSHPLAFGFHSQNLPVFRRGSLSMEISENPYATPAVYTSEPLLAGYVHKETLEKLRNSASILVSRKGQGRSILFSDELTFRAFWYGTNKLLANAIFFGHFIN